MKKTLFLLMLVAGLCASAQNKRVLFVGNSYTEVNNLPQLVSKVAESMGDAIDYTSNTPGGCTFAQHCNNLSMSYICQGNWDVVVLQEQSQYPSFPPNQVQNEVFPYAAQLVDSVYAHSPCAEPMFYMTWGHKYGDQDNAPYYPVLGTYEGMDSMLYERYMWMGQQNDAAVSPVGRVWRYLRNNSNIELYQSDNSHPSLAGSYAAACCFYVMIFERNPRDITFSSSLDEGTAATIREAVKTVVYDNLSFWKRPLPQAQFQASQQGSNMVMQNNSLHAEEYLWDFGDGNSSTAVNPSHHYANSGNYTVTLTASRHCIGHITQQTVYFDATTTAITDAEDCTLRLFPNPASHQVCVELTEPAEVTVSDLLGREVMQLRCPAGRTVLDSQRLQGLYQVRARGEKGTTTLQLMIK